MASLYQNPGDAYAYGIKIAGVKYIAVLANDNSIYGKKGGGGVVTGKSSKGKTNIV